MALLLLIIDGMTDEPAPVLNGLTPYGYAGCAVMEELKRQGAFGELTTCPPGLAVDSLNCISTLLGVDATGLSGRAYYEAVAFGIPVMEYDLILRCNLVGFDRDGRLVTSCGAGLDELSKQKAAALVATEIGPKMKLYSMSSYKNLLILKDDAGCLDEIKTYPPHEHLGKRIETLLPVGGGRAKELRGLFEYSVHLLKPYSSDGLSYGLLAWGASKRSFLPCFESLHVMKGAAVCATEIVRGIALCMGLHVPILHGATADIDTDLYEKASVALRLAKEYEFILIHVNGADEAAHRKDPKQKAAFLKRVDAELVSHLYEKMTGNDRLMICSDHATLCCTGGHRGGNQAFILYGPGIRSRGYQGVFDGGLTVKLMQAIR